MPITLLLVMDAVYIYNKQYTAAALSLAIVGVVLFPILLNTNYTITTDATLRIKCGLFLNLLIPIASIKKIVPTKTILSSPALSLDRIEIFYNQYDSVIISPENKEDFIIQLQHINPAIHYEQ